MLWNKIRQVRSILAVLMISTVCYSQTVDSVYKELVKQGIKNPKIVLAQSIEETGWYKCINCSLSRNNIFGFWYKKKYLEFNTWQESVGYYARWQNRHYTESSYEDYYEFLIKRNYASNPKYISNLKKIVKSLNVE